LERIARVLPSSFHYSSCVPLAGCGVVQCAKAARGAHAHTRRDAVQRHQLPALPGVEVLNHLEPFGIGDLHRLPAAQALVPMTTRVLRMLLVHAIDLVRVFHVFNLSWPARSGKLTRRIAATCVSEVMARL